MVYETEVRDNTIVNEIQMRSTEKETFLIIAEHTVWETQRFTRIREKCKVRFAVKWA